MDKMALHHFLYPDNLAELAHIRLALVFYAFPYLPAESGIAFVLEEVDHVFFAVLLVVVVAVAYNIAAYMSDVSFLLPFGHPLPACSDYIGYKDNILLPLYLVHPELNQLVLRYQA